MPAKLNEGFSSELRAWVYSDALDSRRLEGGSFERAISGVSSRMVTGNATNAGLRAEIREKIGCLEVSNA
jgi:hypothetical protein